jgi:hypothetical protein
VFYKSPFGREMTTCEIFAGLLFFYYLLDNCWDACQMVGRYVYEFKILIFFSMLSHAVGAGAGKQKGRQKGSGEENDWVRSPHLFEVC